MSSGVPDVYRSFTACQLCCLYSYHCIWSPYSGLQEVWDLCLCQPEALGSVGTHRLTATSFAPDKQRSQARCKSCKGCCTLSKGGSSSSSMIPGQTYQALPSLLGRSNSCQAFRCARTTSPTARAHWRQAQIADMLPASISPDVASLSGLQTHCRPDS